MGIQQCFVCDRCNASFVGGQGDAVQRGYRRVTVSEPSVGAASQSKEYTVVREFCASCVCSFEEWIRAAVRVDAESAGAPRATAGADEQTLSDDELERELLELDQQQR